jgi:hypothetical protein
MQVSGTASWSIRSDELCVIAQAIYVRDAAGLDTSRNPDAPPPLDPPIPVNDAWRQRFVDGAEAWNAWWSRLIRELATAPSEAAVFEDAVADATGDVRALLDAVLPAAQAWARERDRARLERFMESRAVYSLAITGVLRSAERELGRRLGPFRLDLLTLPVRGLWSRRVAVGAEVPELPGLHPSPALLLSGHLQSDPVELERALRPIIVALA